MLLIAYTHIYIFLVNFLVFNFVALHVLRLGPMPHVPHPWYGSGEGMV
jgi:hypothetical protein